MLCKIQEESLCPQRRPFFAFGWGTVASRTAPRGRDPSRRRPAVILERSEESRGGLLEDDNYRAEWGSHSPLVDRQARLSGSEAA